MAKPEASASVDEYIAQLPSETQKVFRDLRSLIRSTAPHSTERISYGILTFDLNGKHLVYLGGWKRQISLYPVTAAMEKTLADELKPYRAGKGTLKFPLGKPMPTELIRRIIQCRMAEMGQNI